MGQGTVLGWHGIALGVHANMPRPTAANTDSAYRTLRPDRQYGRIDSTRLTGVTDVQKTVLETLGAVKRSR